MEPIKIEVAVNVSVDMSQGTKDFLLKVLERKIEAENERAEKAASPLMSLLALAQSNCGSISAKPEPEAEPEPEAKPEPSKEKPAPAKTIGIENVRAALTAKVNDHRETIRAKLTELGAKSVTTLDPSKYQEMYDFLNSL